MKKRIVSIILCLAMLLTVLPAAVSAAGNIRSISVSVAMNVADGEPIPFDSNLLVEGEPDYYTAYFWSYSWFCSDGIMLPDPYHMPNFQGGEHYRMMLLIVPKDGTAGLNSDTAASLPVFINGQKAKYNPECKPELSEAPGKEVYAYEIDVQCPWTTVISVIDVYGAVLPTPGAIPTVSGLSVPAGAPYEIDYANWICYTGKPGESSFYSMPEGTAFQNGVYYYLAVDLVPKDGYSFAPTEDCIFRINGTSDMADTVNSRISGSVCSMFTNDYQAQPRHVDEIRIDNLNPFYVGETPASALKDITIPAGAGYSIFSIPDCNVSYVSTNTYINDDSLFEADTSYRATFCIRPAEGWTIDSSTVWRINGSSDLVFFASESTDYWFVKTVEIPSAARTPIEEVYIYGYETPKVGEMAGDYLNMFTVGGLYDIVEAYWLCDTTHHVLLENETFVEGRLYSACVALEACDPAFSFDGPVEFYLNSGEFPMDFGYVEDGSAFVWTAQMYPETAGHTVSWYLDPAATIPVTGVEVADGEVFGAPAEPAKEGYTFGGWYTDRACTVPYDPTAPIYADTDLFPKWIPAAEIITEVSIGGFEAPRAGETRIGADALFVPGDAPYSISSLEWYYAPTSYTAESFTGPFVEGNAYFASICVTPDEGYAFAEDTVVKINGLIVTDWFPFLDPSGDFCIDSPDIVAEGTPVYIPITAVNAQIPEPVIGQKPAAKSDIVVTST
ncbi:MAG: InlB B-repeat-containing protein, partial [Clostridia bacterium]|nr:InlB B-repeat-containing protein [Clostridia bacterium]